MTGLAHFAFSIYSNDLMALQLYNEKMRKIFFFNFFMYTEKNIFSCIKVLISGEIIILNGFITHIQQALFHSNSDFSSDFLIIFFFRFHPFSQTS